MILDKRVYVITGAASGIGAATACLLAGEGVRLYLHTASQAERLNNIKAECESLGAEVETFVGDLRKEGSLESLSKAVVERGQVDGFVHCAGYPDWRNLADASLADLQASFDVTQKAFFALSQAFVPLLKESKQARIVSVSSFLAHKFYNDSFTPISAAAKAGLEALVKSFAAQLASDKITVNAVVPGYIKKDHQENVPSSEEQDKTPKKIPLQRLGEPKEVADLIEFLLSDKAAYITGQCIHVDGGLTL